MSKNYKKKVSYGILLYYFDDNLKQNKFLLVRRKDSIEYVQIIRGNYNLTCEKDIKNMFSRITKTEFNNLKTLTFKQLWEKLWMKSLEDDTFRIEFKKNYEKSLNKFQQLKNTTIYKTICKNFKFKYDESEWGIPKGRKNSDETDIDCAIREFSEETNINDNYYIILNSNQFIEEYIGSDNKTYKHIYYLAKSKTKNIDLKLDLNNRSQVTEISSIDFFTYSECLKKIRDYSKEKLKIIEDANNYILNSNLNNFKPYNINLN
uniref:Nudix hydrolase domain-containing protein n=1 Tax=viral metagenome TaxID=1070528 RepID=A0A6C0J183_9ZZZZ